jgi:hypothetical protein
MQFSIFGENMKSIRFSALLLLFSVFFCSLHGRSGYASEVAGDDLADTLLQHGCSSIEKIEGQHLYLQPKKVCVHGKKIYVESDLGEAIPISHLFADESGLYVIAGKKQEPKKTWICTKCNQVYYLEPKECERCHNKTFIIQYCYTCS